MGVHRADGGVVSAGFAEEGLADLGDRPRKALPAMTVTDKVRDEILTATLTRSPAELGIGPAAGGLAAPLRYVGVA